MIPRKLYRGDKKDSHRVSSVEHGFILTDLLKGGIGQDIFKKKLVDCCKMHIDQAWNQTHFLSFSDNREKAVEYACAKRNPPFDYYIIEFDGDRIEDCQKLEQGVYKCKYSSLLNEFQPTYEIVMINTVDFLIANPNGDDSHLKKAKLDSEWLILPAQPVMLNFQMVEYSAKLDMGRVFTYQGFEAEI